MNGRKWTRQMANEVKVKLSVDGKQARNEIKLIDQDLKELGSDNSSNPKGKRKSGSSEQKDTSSPSGGKSSSTEKIKQESRDKVNSKLLNELSLVRKELQKLNAGSNQGGTPLSAGGGSSTPPPSNGSTPSPTPSSGSGSGGSGNGGTNQQVLGNVMKALAAVVSVTKVLKTLNGYSGSALSGASLAYQTYGSSMIYDDYSYARKESSNLGAPYGYTSETVMNAANANMSKAGLTGDTKEEQKTNLDTDMNSILRTSKALGIDTNTLASTSGYMTSIGAFEGGDQQKFANLLAESISKAKMTGREDEQLQVLEDIADNLASVNSTVSSESILGSLNMYNALVSSDENLKGERGAQYVTSMQDIAASGNSTLDVLAGFGTEYTGLSGKLELRRLAETNPEEYWMRVAQGAQQYGMTDDQITQLIYQQTGSVSKADTIVDAITKMRNGDYSAIESLNDTEDGEKLVDEQIDNYTQDKDLSNLEKYNVEKQETKDDVGDMVNKVKSPFASWFNGLSDGWKTTGLIGSQIAGLYGMNKVTSLLGKTKIGQSINSVLGSAGTKIKDLFKGSAKAGEGAGAAGDAAQAAGAGVDAASQAGEAAAGVANGAANSADDAAKAAGSALSHADEAADAVGAAGNMASHADEIADAAGAAGSALSHADELGDAAGAAGSVLSHADEAADAASAAGRVLSGADEAADVAGAVSKAGKFGSALGKTGKVLGVVGVAADALSSGIDVYQAAKDKDYREAAQETGGGIGSIAGGAGGAWGGAAAGAAIGSIFPGVGTAIGGGIGALIGGIGGSFLGDKAGEAAGEGIYDATSDAPEYTEEQKEQLRKYRDKVQELYDEKGNNAAQDYTNETVVPYLQSIGVSKSITDKYKWDVGKPDFLKDVEKGKFGSIGSTVDENGFGGGGGKFGTSETESGSSHSEGKSLLDELDEGNAKNQKSLDTNTESIDSLTTSVDSLNDILNKAKSNKTDSESQWVKSEADDSIGSTPIIDSTSDTTAGSVDTTSQSNSSATGNGKSTGSWWSRLFGKSHAVGNDYVPYDNYQASLHRGEMVLTKFEADEYRQGKFDKATGVTKGSVDLNINVTGNIDGMTSENQSQIVQAVIAQINGSNLQSLLSTGFQRLPNY